MFVGKLLWFFERQSLYVSTYISEPQKVRMTPKFSPAWLTLHRKKSIVENQL